MEDVLEVYERPYNAKNPVLCFDESPKQLVSEVRKSYIDSKGVKYEDCEYKREGAAEIFMIIEPLGGHREVFLEDRHTGVEWAKTMAYITEEMYPNAEKITVIMDNLSSHKIYNLYEIFTPQRAKSIKDRLEIVYTPKHGSWLNIAECELSVMSRQALKKRFASAEELNAQIKAWASKRNQKQRGVNWQFTTKDARIKLSRLYPTVLT